MVAPTPLFFKNGVLRIALQADRDTPVIPANTDSILVENVRIGIDPQLVNTDEMTGSLDPAAPIPGGMRTTLTFDTYVKGSGTGGTAPEFGDLFKICGWREDVFAAIPAESLATTGNSSTAVTLGDNASTVAQFYRGLPLLLAGPNVGTTIALVTNYTADKIATLDRVLAGVGDDTDEYAIPAAVRYAPTSDRNLHKVATAWLYTDGLLWKFEGCAGNFDFAGQAGNPGRITWTLQGMFAGRSDAAKPTDSVFDDTRPPVWRNPDGYSGAALLDRAQVAMRQLTFGPQNQLVMPDNPNALEGFDPGVVPSRNLRLAIDPLMTLVATRDLISGLRNSTKYIYGAHWGQTAGNRFAFMAPAAQPTTYAPSERDRMWAEQTDFFCSGEDSGAFMTFY